MASKLLTLNGTVSELETVLGALLAASAVVTDVWTSAGLPAHVIATILGAIGVLLVVLKAAVNTTPPTPTPPASK